MGVVKPILGTVQNDVPLAKDGSLSHCLADLQPLPASFAVVIYSCAASGKFQAAETVYNLVASGANRRPSWVAYLKGLTSAGYHYPSSSLDE